MRGPAPEGAGGLCGLTRDGRVRGTAAPRGGVPAGRAGSRLAQRLSPSFPPGAPRGGQPTARPDWLGLRTGPLCSALAQAGHPGFRSDSAGLG